MDCITAGFPVPHHLPELAQVHVQLIGDVIQLSHPLLPFFLPSVFPSIRVFSNESAVRIRQSKYWNFSISPSNQHSQLISFKVDWFDLLVVQGTFKKLLQHHSLKTSILWYSAFFMVQFSHPYLITRKTLALTLWTFVSKAMSLFLTHCLGLS